MLSEHVSLESVRAAAAALKGVAVKTPLLVSDDLSEAIDAPAWLKCENLQRGGAFKFRGAYTFMTRLAADVRARGVITYSSGNHGRGVALAARVLGCTATVVVPEDIPAIKRTALEALGAEVVVEGLTSLERQRKAEELAGERGHAIVPPFDHLDIIAGQGTVGLEILEQAPDVQRVVVPVGGGGLISGIAATIRQQRPDVEVYGVQPAGAAAMQRSLEAGEPITLDRVDTVADGLKPVRPGDLTFAHVRRWANGILLVEDPEILDAVVWCFERAKLVVEPSGAAAVAALLSGKLGSGAGRPHRTVAVISGGNAEPAYFRRWLEKPAARVAQGVRR